MNLSHNHKQQQPDRASTQMLTADVGASDSQVATGAAVTSVTAAVADVKAAGKAASDAIAMCAAIVARNLGERAAQPVSGSKRSFADSVVGTAAAVKRVKSTSSGSDVNVRRSSESTVTSTPVTVTVVEKATINEESKEESVLEVLGAVGPTTNTTRPCGRLYWDL